MKVLLTTGLYPPDIGGPATYAAMVEAELPNHGIEVTVLPFSGVRKYPKWISHLVFLYRVWSQSKSADVLYTLDPVSVGVPTALVARLRRKPLLLRLGGDYAWEQGRERFGVQQRLEEFVETKQTHWRVRLLQVLQTFTARVAYKVVVPSQYLGSVIEKWGIDADKITVVYSVLHPLPVRETKTELREQYNVTGPTLLSAGRLVPWKGFITLVKVVSTLREDFPDLHLYIAGEGSQRQNIEESIAELGLEQSVTLLGKLDKQTLGAYKKLSDVFVLNTGYEGLSHELLEVMELGVPVVTTKVGGNPELITDGRDGLLVAYDDEEALRAALTRVLQDDTLSGRLTQAARVRLQNFTKEQSIAALQELLQSVHGTTS